MQRPVGRRGGARVWLNITLAVTQVAAIVWASANAFSADVRSRPLEDAAVVPALYTFAVWGPIYGLSLAYAVYQALPIRRHDALLHALRPWTALAFLASTLWSLAAGSGRLWGTVACMALLLVGLVGALVTLIQRGRPRTTTEGWLVDAPVGAYAGYITLAMVANTASVLKHSGVTLGAPEAAWACVMLLVAGAIVAFTVRASRGNVGYALTAAWGLTGVLVQNALVTTRPSVAIAAGVTVATTLVTLVWCRRFQRGETARRNHLGG